MKREAIVLCLLAACATEATTDDGVNDPINLGGKADGALKVTPAELSQIFELASLDRAQSLHDQVGLSSDAANAIDALAAGPDGHRGSVDDTYFQTVAQLDAVPYVGPVAFEKLRAYAHASGRIDNNSDAWSVESEMAYTLPRSNDLWHGDPAFAIDRTGVFVALYESDKAKLTLVIGDQSIPVPTDDQTTDAYQTTHLAVDETNAIHVFYAAWVGANAFKHFTYRAGQWTEHPMITTDRLDVVQNGAGAIWALSRGQRWVGSQLASFTELHHFASTDAHSTVEALPSTAAIFAQDPTAIGVGADGLPVITWLHGTCASSACAIESLQLLRRTASGFTSSHVAGDPTWRRDSSLATGGGANATVVISRGWDTTLVLRESNGTFVAAADVDKSKLPIGVGTMTSAVVDANGVLHGCAKPSSTSKLNELEVDATGHGVGTQVLEGMETQFCAIVLDSTSRVNLIYGNNSVFVRATR